ncbi:nuclear transport factor 2 family protein [Nocardia sp. BMG51109]|uniref:nuclear transport factor 2 family protein n=1 Tax=Nocardia sp. BMG51109 TaxID=1056816 RepID=UPI000462F39F|nr:nuclear transport factor 2 family protein [Nocardia sp. BMG51109]
MELRSAAFEDAVSNGDRTALLRALDEHVVFRSPVMEKPYHGADQVGQLVDALTESLAEFRYTAKFRAASDTENVAPEAEILVFEARVGGKALTGIDLLTFDAAGAITELTVLVRPLPAAMTLARVVGAKMLELESRT